MNLREKRKLPCPLDAREREERARQLADTVSRLGEIDDARAAAMAKFREAKKKEIDAQRELADAVESGQELREVECIRVAEAGVVRVIRCDTNECIESTAETQLSLVRS